MMMITVVTITIVIIVIAERPQEIPEGPIGHAHPLLPRPDDCIAASLRDGLSSPPQDL